MNVTDRKNVTAPAEAKTWLGKFEAALLSQDAAAAAELFLPDGLWRDVVAFTWNLQTMSGQPAIEATLRETIGRTEAVKFRIPPGRTPPRDSTPARPMSGTTSSAMVGSRSNVASDTAVRRRRG